jgi:hypothetical protein
MERWKAIVQERSNLPFIRARVRRDLENLIALLGSDSEIHTWQEADYRYRIIVDLETLLEIIVRITTAIDYPNFKNRVGEMADQREKLGAYHDIWGVMGELQK